MVNDVKNSGLQGNNTLYHAKKQHLEQVKQDSVKHTSSSRGAEKDSVALTPQAKQLKELQKKISDGDGFDRKKVEEIKKAITEGAYSINYERLASKLAAFEFDL